MHEIDATTGATRIAVDEKGGADFLIDASILVTRAIDDGRERIWSSERDGWNHFKIGESRSTSTSQGQ